MLAPGQSKSPRKGKKGREANGRRGDTAVGTDIARACSPSPVWAQPPGAPDTPTAPRRPRHRVPRSRAGPRGGQLPGRVGAARAGRRGSRGRAARAALLTWRSASRIGRRPPRLAPACFPAPGSPEQAAWTAAAAAPRPPCTGSRCAPVRRRAERAASGSGARGKLWLGVCDRENRDPRSFGPSSLPHSRPPAVIWSRSCRPLAASSGRTGPDPPPRPHGGPLQTGWV